MHNSLETKRSEHIDVKRHFVRHCLSNDRIRLVYVSTQKQITDIFTKSLALTKFKKIRES